MKYQKLSHVYKLLESSSKRLEKTRIISEFFVSLDIDEIEMIVPLLKGRVFPQWDETNYGVAARLVVKALCKSTGATSTKIEQVWKKTGDLGLTAEQLTKNKTQNTLLKQDLSVKKVFSNLRKLSTLVGQGSVEQKIQLISELLTSADPTESRYITRTILEDLRVGVGEGLLRDSIVWANFSTESGIEYNEKNAQMEIKNREAYKKFSDAVQQAFDLTNDYGLVAKISKTEGVKGLLKLSLVVGRPIKVMLALRATDAKDALQRVKTPAEVEYKLDGFRVQVHKEKEKVKLFTRRLDDVTAQFDDIVRYVKSNVNAKSCILDAEAVGYSVKTEKYLPFQKISQRIKRKHNIDEIAKKFPVELNVFDIIFFNGKNLLSSSFKSRREILEKVVKEEKRKIKIVERIITSDEKEVVSFFKKSIEAGNEGLMLKNIDSPYKPGARVGHMVKLKETMENLDLVIVGAEWGEGKRASWLSSYTLACKDEFGEFLEIGKVSTGLKEKEEEGLSFSEMTKLLKPLIKKDIGKQVIVKPELIIEVAYEEIQRSPTYASGFALRFPRVVRLRTDEKSVDEVTTIDYIEEIYNTQKN